MNKHMFPSSYTKLWALWVVGSGTEIKIFRNAFVGAATKKTSGSLTWQCASLEVLAAVPVRIQSSGYDNV
jgi:hypothetical protein